MEFEDLVLEFDETLEENTRKECCVNKTGGRLVGCHVHAFTFYVIINCVIQLLGSWLAMGFMIKGK